ncbi:MAG: [FeFe] hydrogenase H-cluster radical SAM maturase HydE [Ruminococcus sp.]|nr:[FeFe] hydrogenase H-cluster radical SAM maturase HydE [Ruminococcus sp.]
MTELIEKLCKTGDLSDNELKMLIADTAVQTAELLAKRADEVRRKYYGNKVFLRGLIEISSYCKNDCLYCGIRRSCKSAERYRLDRQQILDCADIGYKLGLRTFVMQGGEDAFFTDDYMCGIISELRQRYPDCAITLSLGERSAESYRKMKEAGADRYLLRHETASQELYSKIHPAEMRLDNRIKCLYNLKETGFQTGSGFMVGVPFQTADDIIKDIRFLQELQPHMIGIGPFIPHKDTPFRNEKGGTLSLTLRLLGILRLMFPKVLLPATTALGTISPVGRELGLKTGCNVIMPNISPEDARKKYNLYDNKLISGGETAEGISLLKAEIEAAGYEIADERGDCVK